jgi:phosphate uptake regulator
MFEKFFKLWSTGNLLEASFEEVENMIDLARDMFEYSINLVIENAKNREDIYKSDQELNHSEREVRRKVLEHLSINPAQDINPSLILVTIIIDIERIGDYSKNIVELADRSGDSLECEYTNIVRDLKSRIVKNINTTIESFKEGNEEKAIPVLEDHLEIANICEENMAKLINEEIKISTRLSIIYTLLFRYIKRVSAHIKNVASSIINPYDRIGFKPKE